LALGVWRTGVICTYIIFCWTRKLFYTNLILYYFQIRWRSDFSFRELTGRSGRQQKEVGRLLGEVNGD
jgi:hypothetical protein